MSNYLFEIFGNSPVGPLQEHMAKAHASVDELFVFFEAVIAKDLGKMKESQQKISVLEQEADSLKKELRKHMPNSIFLPVSRSDLLELIRIQDTLANKSKDISGLMLGREMSLPEALRKHFLSYIKRSVDASKQARKIINEFDALVGTGFRGNEVKFVKKLIRALNKIEGDTDQMQVTLRKKMFEIEKDYPPVDVMFLYQIIQWIGEIADIAEKIGSRLYIMLAK